MKRIIILTLILTSILNSCKNPKMGEPINSEYLTINNSKIYYEIFGQGEPIILIHPGVTDSRVWDFQIEELSQEFKVIRFDQRGFGKSSMPTENYNAVKDILTLMDSCKISKANIVGICLGALQAIDLAIEYPDRVKTLIISGTGLPDWPLSKDVLDKHINFTQYVMENGPDSAVQRMLTDPFWSQSIPENKYQEGKKLFEKILWENKMSFTVNWQLRELPMGLADRFGEIDCPVLMFRPEKEIPFIIPIADTIAAKVPNIKVIEVSGASHLLNMEKPEEFSGEIIDFINSGGV